MSTPSTSVPVSFNDGDFLLMAQSISSGRQSEDSELANAGKSTFSSSTIFHLVLLGTSTYEIEKLELISLTMFEYVEILASKPIFAEMAESMSGFPCISTQWSPIQSLDSLRSFLGIFNSKLSPGHHKS